MVPEDGLKFLGMQILNMRRSCLKTWSQAKRVIMYHIVKFSYRCPAAVRLAVKHQLQGILTTVPGMLR